MRITVDVRVIGVTESGLSLADRDGNGYHWITKHHGHPLFFALSGEWYKVRMTVTKGWWGQNIAKNVRIIKEG